MNTNDLALFVCTADSGSITRAAEKLSMTTAAASAALKRLEKQLDVQLFIRSTRRLRITAEGDRFLVYCREALERLDAGKASLHEFQGKVAGELRISAPSDIGRNLLLPWIDEIMEQHSELSINLTLGDSLSDFYLDQVDLAIRYGDLEDSSMVAFKLDKVIGVVCASPSYLEKYGIPQTPEDLKNHNCLLYHRNNRVHDLWEFLTTEEDVETKHKVRVESNRSSNDSDVVRLWALAGKGIAYKSIQDLGEDLRQGRLVRILEDYKSEEVDLNLICPSREQITPAVLLIRDIFREKFARL